MTNKGKPKLQKNQFELEGRIIDLERFAYDISVHSAKKFGVAEECICSWEGEENDYSYDNFISVISRCLFRKQILYRFDLYCLFVSSSESTNFETFQKIHNILQNAIACTTRKVTEKKRTIIVKFIISLTVINEFINFLFSKNCKLYLKELARFWFQDWCKMKKKDLVKAGVLVKLYEKNISRKCENFDVFCDQFIPKFCIPYESSCIRTLEETYREQKKAFYKEFKTNLSQKGRRRIDNTMPLTAKTLERDEASGINLPRNAGGLGVPMDEKVLRNSGVVPVDPATSPKNIPNTSRQKMKLCSRSSLEDSKRLNTCAPSSQNPFMASRERTERNSKGSCSQIEAEKENSCSGSIMEDFEEMKSVFLEEIAATSLPSSGDQQTVRDRRGRMKDKN